MRYIIIAFLVAACGGGSDSKPDAAPTDKLGDNPAVSSTCQMCLEKSSGNECMAKEKACTSDADCKKLNSCVNKCTNINNACIQSCGDGASQNAIDAWTAWESCACGTCASQCDATFCGTGGGQCVADDMPCSQSEACCTFCASDGNCGCIPSGDDGCQTDHDCCSNSCGGGVCN